MVSGLTTSWQIDGETMESVTDFIFLGSKITADDDSSHEIKRHLLLGRKAVTNLDSVLKSRDLTLPTKVHLVKTMVFFSSHVWMWELDHKEVWVPNNWCFWTVVLEKILEIPWTTRRSNESILKEINPEHSLEGLMLKLKLQYFGHLPWRADSLEKTLMLGKKDWRQEEKGTTEDEMFGWHHRLNGHEFEKVPGDGEGQGSLACCSLWSRKESDTTEQLKNKFLKETQE